MTLRRAAITLVIAASVVWRFVNLDRLPFWDDEANTALRLAGYSNHEVDVEFAVRFDLTAEQALRFQRPDPDSTVDRTSRVLLAEDPQHAPLYFWVANLWSRVVGDTPARLRALSALLSLLLIPAAYWLALEVYRRRAHATVALLLACVAPLPFEFGRQAREYGMWVVTTAACHAAFLRARRRGGLEDLALYALLAAVNLFTSFLGIFALAGHAIYLVFVERRRGLRDLACFSGALLPAAVLVVWWVSHMAPVVDSQTAGLAWLYDAVPIDEYAKLAALDLARAVYDADAVGRSRIPGFPLQIGMLAVSLAVLAAAVWHHARQRRRELAFVVLAGFLGLAVAMLFDLIAGGSRARITRYHLPTVVSSLILLAGAIGDWLERRPRRGLAVFVFVFVFGAGALSVVRNGLADTWWTSLSPVYRAALRVAAAEPAPVILSTYIDGPLALAHIVPAHVHLAQDGRDDRRRFFPDKQYFLIKPAAPGIPERIAARNHGHWVPLGPGFYRFERDGAAP